MTPQKAAAFPSGSARHLWLLVLGFVFFPAPLFALITLSFQSTSRPMVGAGTPIVIVDYGTVSAYGPLASGVSRTIGASDYTVSADFGVRVTRLISFSSSYTLQARLQTATGLTWRVDGTTLSTSPVTVATLQPYATTIPHTLSFVVPFTRSPGLVTTTLEVTAIAN